MVSKDTSFVQNRLTFNQRIGSLLLVDEDDDRGVDACVEIVPGQPLHSGGHRGSEHHL